MPADLDYAVIIIGGGHAGAEAAWAAANMLRAEYYAAHRTKRTGPSSAPVPPRVALVTMDPSKIGAMSCNPAIGGLAKGQIVREIDAMGGLMGLAADATGIQFRVLNASKGPAVRGPRCQSDKYRYAREVQRLLGTRENLDILAGRVEEFIVEGGWCAGIVFSPTAQMPSAEPPRGAGDCCGDFGACEHDRPLAEPGAAARQPLKGLLNECRVLRSAAVVLTTGTFMRGLMHTGERQTEGGRVGEAPAVGISATLKKLGFELARLKTGTPPRLAAETIDLASLEVQAGDDVPLPFSDMTVTKKGSGVVSGQNKRLPTPFFPSMERFPVIEQRPCWITATNQAIHDLIRANLDRAPMYNGQIATTGPRYCPSIEDKVVRFADRQSHHVFLEPESLETNEIYCNGISTSLPGDVQERIVHGLPGCEQAKILRFGYAVEYDMVPARQIDATCMTKLVPGLFFAGQINGTTGYEEAAGQGLIAGINAVRWSRGQSEVRLGRDQAYIGVLMDDLVTKVPLEPYRMFTSRAEFRLLLRADNTDERLTPLGRELGLVDDARWAVFQQRQAAKAALLDHIEATKIEAEPMRRWMSRAQVSVETVAEVLKKGTSTINLARQPRVIHTVLADIQYAGYIDRQRKEIDRLAAEEDTPLPCDLNFAALPGLRGEAAQMLNHFKPATVGQARRLAGVNPADLMVVSVAMSRA